MNFRGATNGFIGWLVLLFATGSAGAAAATVTQNFQVAGRSQAFEDVSAQVDVAFSAMRWNRSRQVWQAEATLRNTGATPLSGPLLVAIMGATGTSGVRDLDNAVNAPAGEPPFLDFTSSLAGGALAPGASTTPRLLSLGRLGNDAPRLVTRVFAAAAVSGEAPLALTQTLDADGQPLPGVAITETGPAGERSWSSERGAGFATLGGRTGRHVWRFSAPGYLSVWRVADLGAGASEVPGPRLTPLANAAVTPTGAASTYEFSAPWRGTALGGSTPRPVRLTPLTPQTLPLPLPSGWHPLQAAWIDAEGTESLALRLAVLLDDPVAAGAPLTVARLDTQRLAWVARLSLNFVPGAAVEFAADRPGAYAVLVPDLGSTAPPAAAVGRDLAGGVTTTLQADELTVTGEVQPAVSLASTNAAEVTARGRLRVTRASGVIPSGTPLGVRLVERYTLSNGQTRTLPAYDTVLTLGRPLGETNAQLAEAEFPLRPRLLLGSADLVEARLEAEVHALEGFSGGTLREGAPVWRQEGWSVGRRSAESLPTLVRLQSLDPGARVPRTMGEWSPMEELLRAERDATSGTMVVSNVRAAVEYLGSFELTAGVSADTDPLEFIPEAIPPDGDYLLLRAWYRGALAGLEPVARFAVRNGAWVSQEPKVRATGARLSGVDRAGQYALVRVPAPLGVVVGTVDGRTLADGASRVVRLQGLPWSVPVESDGTYRIAAPEGEGVVELTRPGGEIQTRESIRMPAARFLELAPLVPTERPPFLVSITPSEGATDVPVLAAVVVRFSKPVRLPSDAALELRRVGDGGATNAVAARVSLDADGLSARLLPVNALAEATRYRLTVSAVITDLAGRPLEAPGEATFTTAAAPVRNVLVGQLYSEPPDAQGQVRVVGTAGMAAPRAPVLFVNDTTGQTATRDASADGSFTHTLSGSVTDRLRVVLVNADGSRTEIPVGRQVFPDGSVALYSGGGRITNRNDEISVVLDVPPGAVLGRTRFTLTPRRADEIPGLTSNTPPEQATAFGAYDLGVEGDAVRGQLRVEVRIDRSRIQPPPGKTVDDLTLFDATFHAFVDPGQGGGQPVPVFRYESLLQPAESGGAARTLQSPHALFAGMYALINPEGGSHLLFGSVYYANTAISGTTGSALFVGGAQVIPGTFVPVGGAIVRARARSVLNSRPFSLQGGELVAISGADGRFAILVPNQGNSGGHATIATHPDFPRQFANGTDTGVRIDPRYPLAGGQILFDRGSRPDDVPPTLSITHAPALPAAGGEVRIRVEAVDDRSFATPSLVIDQVDPAATALATELQPGVWRVTCSAKAKVVLQVRAEDSAGNVAQQPYVVLFGEAPVPPRPPNDPLGPYVIFSDPDANAVGVSLLRPLSLRFNEWLDLNTPQNAGNYFTLTPSAGRPTVSFGADPSEVRLLYPQLQEGTEYTLTVQGVRDLNGQLLDQNPATNTPPAEPFQLRFRTAPHVEAALPSVAEGGGAVVQGAYAYVIDRRGMTLNRYDLSIPGQPVLSGQRALPGPPRALTLVKDYAFTREFADPTVASDQPGPVQTADLLVVAGRTAGAGLGYVRVYDLRADFESAPALGAALLSLDETALFGRLTWSAPFLVLPENTLAAPQVHVFNLQLLLLADAYRALDQDALLALPGDPVPAVDANHDGDFVDPGDRLPVVGRDVIDLIAGEVEVLSLNPNRRGPQGIYQLVSSTRFLTDVALDGGAETAFVATGPGADVLVEQLGYPVATNRLDRPSAVRSFVIGQSSPDTLVPNVISNAFSLEFPGWYPKRLLLLHQGLQRLLLVNLVALDNSASAVRIVDASRPDALFELGSIPLPRADYGLLQGAELDGQGRIVLSLADVPRGGTNAEDLLVLDPAKLLLPLPASGPHPAILGRLGGVGTGVTPFAVSDDGISVGSLRSRNVVSQGPPRIRFLPAGTNTLDAVQLLDPEERVAALRALPEAVDLPVATQGTNRVAALGTPASTWYVLVEAPGGAGRTAQLALASLGPEGSLASGTNTVLRSFLPDLQITRLSSDPIGEAFGVYLSEPITLVPDGTPEAEVQRWVGSLRLLRAGVRVRLGIPESMAGNPVLGPFAGIGAYQNNPPPNAPPVRLGASQSRPVHVLTPTLSVDQPLTVRTTVDRINQRACPGNEWLYFEHNLDADVSITVDGQPLRNVFDEQGNPILEFTDVRSVAGRHRVLLDAAMVPAPGDHRVEVSAKRFAGLDPARQLSAVATLQHEIEMHQSFPIGHTIIQGVDLWDGHLGHSAEDIRIPGRKLSLAFGRTYSSAGDASAGPLGAGWTHSYNIRLVHSLNCGVFTVIGGEGSGNAFTDPNLDPVKAALYLPLLPAGTAAADLEFLKPQIGYHSTLVRDRNRPDTFWFFTKEGVRYDFVSEGSLSRGSSTVFTLRLIREPNGNALGFDYTDGDSDTATLDTVTELDPLGALPKRGFHFEYAKIAGESRIHTLRGFNRQGSPDLLGLEVHYAYDADGNLTNVTRLGPSPAETRTEQYRYTPGTGPTGHNLIETVGPNGAVTRYAYASATGGVGSYYASGPAILPGLPPHEIVTNVTHVGAARPGFVGTDDQSYGFRYDFPANRRFVAEPRTVDGDGAPIPETEYTVNSYGATVRIRAPLGQESEMRWATDHLDGSVLDAAGQPVHDVVMTWRRDPEGQEQFLEYHDGRGNLTRERSVFGNSTKQPVTDAQGRPVTEVEQRFAMDAVFNQRTNVVDAEGRVTLHVLDPATGNLRRTHDALGGVVRFEYYPNGDLRERVDVRGFTTRFPDYDLYGNARRVVDPLGHETQTTFDERGRLRETRDALGHHQRATFDALDRKVREERLNDLSGLATGPDAITGSRYDAAGLVLESTNHLGLVTRHAYDALNRQIRSELIEVPQADGSSLTYTNTVTLDRAGNLLAETDARGVTRQHTYDALGRRLRTRLLGPFGGPSNGSGIIAELAYDRAGNLTNEVDLHGFATAHVQDALYRVVETHLPFAGAVLANRYDRVGNRTRFTDAEGVATEVTYDALNRVRQVRNALGHESVFEYDPAGNRTNTLDRTSGLVTRVEYDAGDREISRTVLGPGLPATGYTTRTAYLDARHEVQVTNPRGSVSRTQRDGLDRVAEQAIDVAGLNLVSRFTYDASGNVLTSQDPQGGDIDVTQKYDSLGRLLRREWVATPDDAAPVVESFAYDPVGNRVGTVDRRGFERRTRFDNLGRAVQVELREPISGGGAWRTLAATTYDDTANRVVQTDARGFPTVLRRDALGRTTRTEDPLGQAVVEEFGPVELRARTDRQAQRVEFDYDALHRLRAVREFDTNRVLRTTSSAEYRDAERKLLTTDRRGLVAVFEHDALGRQVRHWRSGGDVATRYGVDPLLLEEVVYDGNGNVVRRIDGNGQITDFVYDGADRVTNVVVGVGTSVAAATSTTYDRVGNVLRVKDGRPHGAAFDVEHTYDARYRRVATANALGQTTHLKYDAANQVLELQEPLGFVTRYLYDELGALLAVDETPRLTAADAGITRFRYDAAGNLRAQQDANGNLVTREYDALNRVTNLMQHTVAGSLGVAVNRTGPFGGGAPLTWNFRYDANGDLRQITDARGQTVELAYDHRRRLTQRSYTGHAEKSATGAPADFQPLSIEYAYDGNGNLTNSVETKQLGAATITESIVQIFDGLDRLVEKRRLDHDDPVGRLLHFAYDVVGNRTNFVDADGRVTATTFDARNRLSTTEVGAAVAGSLTTSFEWEADELLRKIAYPGGTFSSRAYDAADRLLVLTNATVGGPTPHSVFVYAYDANGNRVTQTETQPGAAFGSESTTYAYDKLNRLLKVTYGAAGDLTYTYAPNGNRLTEKGKDPVSGSPVDREFLYAAVPARPVTTFSGVNVLTRIEDHAAPALSIDYDYDANLNQIGRTQGADVRTFRFDTRDQMIAATVAGVTTRFDYNADRLRAKKLPAAGPEVRYLYDQSAVVQEYGPASTSLATQHVYDYGTALLAYGTPAAGGGLDRQFYLVDGQKTVAGLVSSGGTLTQQYRHDAWGRLRASAGASPNPRQYTGHFRDSETGLHYFGARYYDDEQARFVSADPNLGEPQTPPSLHRYLYAYANPLRFSDPTGFAAKSGDPTDRWIAETKEMLQGMDQRMEQDIAKQGEGALETYRAGQRAAEEMQRMGEERVRMLQEAGLTEADLRNPVMADRAKWGLALVKRDLEKWTLEGDAKPWRAVVAGMAYVGAQLVTAPFEMGAAAGTLAGKLDVGAEVTAGEWIFGALDAASIVGAVGTVGKIGLTEVAEQAAKVSANRAARGAVIAEARRTIGREVGAAVSLLDEAPKRAAWDRQWHALEKQVTRSAEVLSAERRLSHVVSQRAPKTIDLADSSLKQLDNSMDLVGSGWNVYSDGQSAYRVLRNDVIAWRENVRTGGEVFREAVRGHELYDRLGLLKFRGTGVTRDGRPFIEMQLHEGFRFGEAKELSFLDQHRVEFIEDTVQKLWRKTGDARTGFEFQWGINGKGELSVIDPPGLSPEAAIKVNQAVDELSGAGRLSPQGRFHWLK